LIDEADGKFVAKIVRRGVPIKNATDLLGWINFDENTGVVEITNLRVQLARSFLDIGYSTKKNSKGLAGAHGEGAKAGALVLVREGYGVVYEASGFNWRFCFPPAKAFRNKEPASRLYCSLTPISKKNSEAPAPEQQSTDLIANPCRDVTVRIGAVGPIKGTNRKPVTMDIFRSWIGVYMDLDRPSEIIETRPYGSIILDERFTGKIFLKGLHIENIDASKLYKYAYDFSTGATDRDRGSLLNQRQQARYLAWMWSHAIHHNRPRMIENYVAMITNTEVEWADVNLLATFLSKSTAWKIWKFLRNQDPSRDNFYHGTRNADKVLHFSHFSLILT
jgi:hypothetical protein